MIWTVPECFTLEMMYLPKREPDKCSNWVLRLFGFDGAFWLSRLACNLQVPPQYCAVALTYWNSFPQLAQDFVESFDKEDTFIISNQPSGHLQPVLQPV